MKKIFFTLLLALTVAIAAMADVTYNRQLEEKAYMGDDQAMYELSLCYRNGFGITPNADKANYWLERAASTGHPKASIQLEMLGNKTSLSDAKRRELAAVEKRERERLEAKNPKYNDALVKKAQSGDAEAQYSLAECYYNGLGVSKDYAEAVMWYRKAAEQGNAGGQNSLGFCYQNGLGVAQDYTEAVKWYRKAAEQGNASGQNNLGVCYEYGKGVAQDNSQAVKWYRKAAEQGNASGQYNLGLCYYNGKGVTKNYTEAVKWYRKAAEQGDAYAQYNLGLCYKNGYGVPKDISQAVVWYRKAARQGDDGAQQALTRLGYSW